MSTFTLYHTNAVDTGIFAGGSWQPTLPLANLYSLRTTKRARSTNTAPGSTQFTLRLVDPVTVRGIQVIATNLSSGSQYKISWYADQSFVTLNGTTGFISVGNRINWSNVSEWFDWLDRDFWLGSLPYIDPDNQGRDIRHTFATPTEVQYLKFEFDDTTNPKGYFEIGYVYVGQAFVPSVNIDATPSFSRVSLTSMAQAVGGAQFFNRRGSRKRLAITWAVLPKEEVLGELDEIVRIQDIDRAVYIDVDPANLDSGYTTSFLARMTQLPESRLLSVFLDGDTAATVGFEFIQVL